jgi:hypothetical protein
MMSVTLRQLENIGYASGMLACMISTHDLGVTHVKPLAKKFLSDKKSIKEFNKSKIKNAIMAECEGSRLGGMSAENAVKECNLKVSGYLSEAKQQEDLKEYCRKNMLVIKRVVPAMDEQLTDLYKDFKAGIELLHKDHEQMFKDLEEIKKELKELKEKGE